MTAACRKHRLDPAITSRFKQTALVIRNNDQSHRIGNKRFLGWLVSEPPEIDARILKSKHSGRKFDITNAMTQSHYLRDIFQIFRSDRARSSASSLSIRPRPTLIAP